MFSRLGDHSPSLEYFPAAPRERETFSAQVNHDTIAVLGAGSWGTALASLWAAKGLGRVLLWGRNQSLIESLQRTNQNPDYLPGTKIAASVYPTAALEDCADASLIVFATPSTALRSIATHLRDVNSNPDLTMLSCTKGIEYETGMRMSQILADIFPHSTVAVLSGPNLAVEVAGNLPTATVVACEKIDIATELQSLLGAPRFRIYTTHEVAGVELGGALKNVFAIATGVGDGLGLGDNAKAALITRSLAELIRLGSAMGGDPRTFQGLSGVGDLMVTCFSKRSRNRTFGERLGRGVSVEDISRSMQMVAEGVPTARSAFRCARNLNIETPIIDQVYAMLYENKTPGDALEELLRRDQKSERD
ncbi:MAG: NAD(P)H-dependent glycerol-3-phosphate dehydrogenase [Spartobacteria bacterium]